MQGMELFNEGLTIMALGMGFVFVFLTVLVIAVSLMTRLVRAIEPQRPLGATHPNARPANSESQAAIEPHQLAAISAAIHQHRNKT